MSSKDSKASFIYLVTDEFFPPQEVAQLRERVHQAPEVVEPKNAEPAPSRWSLGLLRQGMAWLRPYSLSGIWHILRRYGISYRRGREAVHSPDPDYLLKRDYARGCVEQARVKPQEVVALYLDEFSFYRQPTVSWSWWSRSESSAQPLARLAHGPNRVRRVVGALDAFRGRVLWMDGAKIGVRKLVSFYRQIRAAYPRAKHIYLIQDNWPVHFHPEVQAAARETRIDIVPLPTYAPWLNPIEKLWRRLKQRILHMHRFSDNWLALQERVRQYLAAFARRSPELLRYVGLLPDTLPD